MRHFHLRLSVVLACAALSWPVFAAKRGTPWERAVKKIERAWGAYKTARGVPRPVVVLKRTLSEGQAAALGSLFEKQAPALAPAGKSREVRLEFSASGAKVRMEGTGLLGGIQLSFDRDGRLDAGSRSVLREVFGDALVKKRIGGVKRVRRQRKRKPLLRSLGMIERSGSMSIPWTKVKGLGNQFHFLSNGEKYPSLFVSLTDGPAEEARTASTTEQSRDKKPGKGGLRAFLRGEPVKPNKGGPRSIEEIFAIIYAE